MESFDQSLKYLLQHEPAEFLRFGLRDPTVEAVAHLEPPPLESRLYGRKNEPVIEERTLKVGPGSQSTYQRVNLRGLRWDDSLLRGPAAPCRSSR